jgi:hypothetical protein
MGLPVARGGTCGLTPLTGRGAAVSAAALSHGKWVQNITFFSIAYCRAPLR